mgnify:CR=1 FL=1
MKLDDFDFDLPEALIATRPARPRVSARLLSVQGEAMTDMCVTDLPGLLRAGDRLILNNTRVIPARLTGARWRDTAQGRVSAKIEITLMGPDARGGWRAMAKPLRKLTVGEVIVFSETLTATVAEKSDTDLRLVFGLEGSAFDAALALAGTMPLPPYIAAKRAPDDQDLAELRARGVQTTEVTLHVGAGTFLPVKVEDVTTHKMHAEWGEVTGAAAAEINATHAAGGRVIAVGTTALRLIESAADSQGQVSPWRGETDIFIYPGYRFRVTDALMTNFHLPKSTLLMLVAALMGPQTMRKVYDHAIERRYRFFSYGDSSLLIPHRAMRH